VVERGSLETHSSLSAQGTVQPALPAPAPNPPHTGAFVELADRHRKPRPRAEKGHRPANRPAKPILAISFRSLKALPICAEQS
jgi:hypothetical protein